MLIIVPVLVSQQESERNGKEMKKEKRRGGKIWNKEMRLEEKRRYYLKVIFLSIKPLILKIENATVFTVLSSYTQLDFFLSLFVMQF
jgi:hypothetical protein